MRRSFETGRRKSFEGLDEVDDETNFDIFKNGSSGDNNDYDELWDALLLGAYTIDVPVGDKLDADKSTTDYDNISEEMPVGGWPDLKPEDDDIVHGDYDNISEEPKTDDKSENNDKDEEESHEDYDEI